MTARARSANITWPRWLPFASASLRHAWRDALAYKTDVFTKLIGYPARVIMVYFLWKKLFDRGAIQGTTFAEVLTYYLVMFLLTQVFPFVRMARDIGSEINSGGIDNCLIRGYPHSVPWLTRYLARAGLYGALVAPVALPLLLFVGTAAHWTVAIPAVLAIVVGTILRGQLWYTLGLSAFFVGENLGVLRIAAVVERVLAGALLPLFLFPEWFQSASRWLPFSYTLYQPVDLLARAATVGQAWTCLAVASGWSAAFLVLDIWLFRLGLKAYSSHGA